MDINYPKAIIFIGLLFTFGPLIYSCSNQSEKKQETGDLMEKIDIQKSEFGRLDGKDVSLFTLTNKNGMEVKITNYGGTITSLKVPDNEGNIEDVVLGFDELSGYRDKVYLSENPYFGALIGRFGNRIAKGRFNLDGQEYTLATNNGSNHLHGGEKGFDKVVWEAEEVKKEDEVGLKLRYVSEDMEEGYPGRLTVEVVYTLTNGNELKINYEATTDKKTIINLTNHAYFNLTGNAKKNILDHEVIIDAANFIPVDETLIPTGMIAPVEGTPFDFTQPV